MNQLSARGKYDYKNIISDTKDSPIKSIKFEGNYYHFKLEYRLPYGECHYARIFTNLLYLKECLGIIKPGDVLLETTSGSGGRAAAAVATALGYKIKIAIPAGGEKARENSIIQAGGELHLTPAEDYVNGFPSFIQNILNQNPGTIYINHAMGDITGRGKGINQSSINAFRPFIHETLESGIRPDIVVCPLGNGTTTLPLIEFKSLFRKSRIIGFESVIAANSHRKLYPGKYEKIFGVDPKVFPRHDLPGTPPANTIFPMPALDYAVPKLDSVELVTSNYTDAIFHELTGFIPTEKSSDVVYWDRETFPDLEEFGRTGRAGFAVAIHLSKKHEMKDRHILIPVFDAAWHYDD